MSKTYLQELSERFPTGSVRQKPTRKGRLIGKWKEKRWIGSNGAASDVRRIDPLSLDLSKYGIAVDTANTVVGDTNP